MTTKYEYPEDCTTAQQRKAYRAASRKNAAWDKALAHKPWHTKNWAPGAYYRIYLHRGAGDSRETQGWGVGFHGEVVSSAYISKVSATDFTSDLGVDAELLARQFIEVLGWEES